MTHSLPRRVTISPEVLVQQLNGEVVMVDLRSERYFGLDDVGTRIWLLLSEHGDVTAAVEQLRAIYDVDEVNLRQDLAVFIGKLAEAGLVMVEQ